MSVGGKKMKYLKHFFSEEDKLKANMGKKNFRQLDQLLDQMADFSVCQHLTRVHRARYMCHSCYHNRGNLTKAWNCEHTDKPHHSNGVCKPCYHQQYYKHKQ